MPETKKVTIRLAALTRVEYTEVLEVPADMTDDELDELLDQRYDEVDGGKYQDAPHFWERGESCEWTPADAGAAVTGTVSREEDGSLQVEETSEN